MHEWMKRWMRSGRRVRESEVSWEEKDGRLKKRERMRGT